MPLVSLPTPHPVPQAPGPALGLQNICSASLLCYWDSTRHTPYSSPSPPGPSPQSSRVPKAAIPPRIPPAPLSFSRLILLAKATPLLSRFPFPICHVCLSPVTFMRPSGLEELGTPWPLLTSASLQCQSSWKAVSICGIHFLLTHTLLVFYSLFFFNS